MGELMTKAEALSLLPAWEVMEAKSCTARAFRTVVALTDEVERLRALIDNPGDHVQTWTPTRDQIVGIAHARTVTITIPSVTIRDHLRARLEAPND